MNNVKAFLVVTIASALFVTKVNAQSNDDEPKKSLSFYGYVSYEAIFDSHESVFTRDGDLYLYPAAPIYHVQSGELLNDNPQLEMLSLQSRLGVRIAGPDVLGAKLTGMVETDFFATKEEYKHHLRIRHALMKLQWEKASLTMGQYWHPMFTPEVFPHVISFGAAAPFNPLNRSPQIRLDYTPSKSLKLVLAALAHGYHSSVGPEAAQRNSALPDLQLQLHVGNSPTFNTGVTVGYMWLQPLLQVYNDDVYRSREFIGAYNLQWFGRLKLNKLAVQAKVSYGENMSQFVMLGGYGRLLDDAAEMYDYGYANILSTASWVEVMYSFNDNWDFGFFGGMASALGSKDKVDTQGPIWYNRGANITNAYRWSPRLVYSQKSVSFALEYLYNSANYGATLDEYAKPDDFTTTINHRVLVSAKYSF